MMKKVLFTSILTFFIIDWGFSNQPSAVFAQNEQAQQRVMDTLRIQCLAKMNEFLEWYTRFTIIDDSTCRVLRIESSQGRKFYVIDSSGTELDIGRYFGSGFFTTSWKENAVKSILAADAILRKIKSNDMAVLSDNVDVPGVAGDPVLSIGGHSNWFQPAYRWELKDFRKLGNDSFSIDLYYLDYRGPEMKWIFRLVRVDGQFKIEQTSGIIDVSPK